MFNHSATAYQPPPFAMSWFAIIDDNTAHFERPPNVGSSSSFLDVGTFVLETALSPEGQPQTLFSFREMHPWERSISVQALPGGGIVLVLSQNGETSHVALRAELTERLNIVRISYSWNLHSGFGRLALEHPESSKVQSAKVALPFALALEDIKAIIKAPALSHKDEDIDFIAFSDEVEPLGPMPSLSASVPLLANGEYKQVDQLKQGDLVTSLENGLVPVLGALSRTVPARGSFRPVRIRAPYFGLQQDVIVAPDQKLVVSQPMVEYMFSREAVLVPARHLVNGRSAIWQDISLTATYHQVILPEHETLFAAGCALESMFIGRLRRKSEHLSETLLSRININLLPEHMVSSFPVLRSYEALTLLDHCAA